MKELTARINANLKRSRLALGTRGRMLEAGDLSLDTKNFSAQIKGESLNLRLKEFESALAARPASSRAGRSWRRRCGDTQGGLYAHHRRTSAG
jgi:hypothetical protein